MQKIKAAKLVESQPQIEKFKAMAKELEADGDESSMDAALRKITKHHPKPTKKG
jgi:hypothetical protein